MRRTHSLKNYLSLCLTFMLIFSLTACGEAKEIPTIQLSLWADERKVALVEEAMNAFKELHADEVNIEFNISEEGEDTCRETVLSNIKGAADIYFFASDQLDGLYDAGALLDISSYTDKSISDLLEPFGGEDSGAAGAVLRDEKVYAMPETASNGYFLYYNKAYLNETDIQTLDGILDVAEQNGKKFTMDYSSGWYIYSFFQGAGLTLTKADSGTTNICNWNATDTPHAGVEVAESMLNLAKRSGFANLGDDGFVEGVEDGTLIAGINGAWNADKIEKAWGDDYAAAKLPTYTLGDEQVQMCSFTGYKLAGINAYTENPEWCVKFLEYFTSEENQIKEFETTGESPANQTAAESEEVQAAPALAALAEQSQYGYVQDVADNFWDASNKFGLTIASGNPDGKDLQELLDKMVKEITG